MATQETQPLDRARQHIDEALQIAIDYLKIASQMHPADLAMPGAEMVKHLLESADCIDRIREGRGNRTDHIGFGTAE